ncbi:hypothetical protein OPQ81_002937 [Rhizoctonia solani]|nr:hypothetical protein OPQ81_002937 [Rhizoctonia solani]
MTFLVSVISVYPMACHTDYYQEIMTNTHPYSECRHENQVLFKLMRKEHPIRPRDSFPEAEKSDRMWGLLVRCWDYDPIIRPTADDTLATLLALE